MGFVSELEALLHPGGDTQAIFTAAAATHSLAAGLRESATSLDAAAAEIEKFWHGVGGSEAETAAAKFQASWKSFSSAITAYAGQLDAEAEEIRKQGEALQSLQDQAVHLDWILGFTGATMLAVGVLTFGFYDVEEAAMAANDLAAAADVMSEWEAFIANSAIRLGALARTVAPIVEQFMLGATADGVSLAFEKWQKGENPLDFADWTPNDISNFVLGGDTALVAGYFWNTYPKLEAFRKANPVLASATWNATAAFAWAVPWEVYVQGNDIFSLKTWETIFESAGVSFGSAYIYKGLPTWLGKGGSWLASKIPILSRFASSGASDAAGDAGAAAGAGADADAAAKAAADAGAGAASTASKMKVTRSDVVDNAITVPVSVEKLYFITGGPLFKVPPSPTAGQPPPASVPQPQLPQVPKAPPVPPHIGGGTETVRPGDSLTSIAQRTLGNGGLGAVLQVANPLSVGPEGQITPGQQLLIPVLPPVPKGSVAHVVQPGQTVSFFAGGDPELEKQIAELNGLKNINLIYAGQVLIIPPADHPATADPPSAAAPPQADASASG